MANNKISADDDYGNNPDMSTNVEEDQEAGSTDGGFGTDSYSADADSPHPEDNGESNNGDTLRYSPAADVPNEEQGLVSDVDPVTGTRESMGSDATIAMPPDIEDEDVTR